MRCHATFRGFRCDQEMSNHNEDEHSFWIRWDDEGHPLVEMPEEGPTLDRPLATREILDEVRGVAEVLGEAPRERGYQVVDGAIRFDEVHGEECIVCQHRWHDDTCTARVGQGAECGCENPA